MVERDDEPKLVRASQQGDLAAFEELVRRHQRMVHAWTFRMTGSLADAQDLAQETFILAYRHLGNFRGEARFSSWLYRLAVNTSLNWTKRERRRYEIHQQLSEQSADEETSDGSLRQFVHEALTRNSRRNSGRRWC